MMRDLTKLYVAILDNKVICFETNLKDFQKELDKIIPKCRNYDFFYREFKKNKSFLYADNGKDIHMQQLV